MKVITETENYVVLFSPEGKQGVDTMNDAMHGMLQVCERLREEGYRPLHYVPRVQGWVCEKPEKTISAAVREPDWSEKAGIPKDETSEAVN